MNYILLYILFLILLVTISILIVTKSYSQKSVNQKIIAVSAPHASAVHTAPTEIKNNNSSLSNMSLTSASSTVAIVKASTLAEAEAEADADALVKVKDLKKKLAEEAKVKGIENMVAKAKSMFDQATETMKEIISWGFFGTTHPNLEISNINFKKLESYFEDFNINVTKIKSYMNSSSPIDFPTFETTFNDMESDYDSIIITSNIIAFLNLIF